MSCCAKFCSSRTTKEGLKDPELSFHTFPKCPVIREQWIKAVRRENWEPTKYSRLCSKHFEKSSFVPGLSIKKLKTDAIPVIFEKYPDYIQPSVATTLEETPRKQIRIDVSGVIKTEDLPRTPRRAMKTTAGREDLIPKLVDDKVRQQYRICEEHFEKTCIKYSKKRTMKFLLDTAFPTLNLYNRTPLKQSTEQNQKCQYVCVTDTPSSSNVNLIKINNLQSVTSFDIATDTKDKAEQSYLQLEAINPRKRKLPYEVVFTARGLCPPVFTPLNEDYSVNYEAIAPYAKYLTNNGIKSVLVGGTTGEHMSLSVAERKRIVDEWIKVGKSIGLHIMVQVGGAPLADVLDLARYCSEVSVDSLLTLPELYFKPQTASELVSYVELIADVAPNLPILYYHIPSMSKVEINMPAFVSEATIRIPNFKGIKFTSNDLSEGAQVLRCLKDGQEMFLGADTLLAPAALLGIKSSIGTTFNLFPRLAQDILDAVDRADIAQARALQEKLSLAVEAHTVEGPWVPIMKAGMEIVTGIQVGPPALPQRPLSKEAKKNIESRLKALKLID